MKKLLISLALFSCGIANAQVGQAWAWSTGKVQNNGQVAIQSTNGSSSYSVVQNPTGAVAKTNQSSVTQPPTVIIQATTQATAGPSYVETVVRMAQNATPVPCPTGYNKIWSLASASYQGDTIFNIAGTQYSFGYFSNNNSYMIGFMRDTVLMATYGSVTRSDGYGLIIQPGYPSYVGGGTGTWNAAVCTK